MSLMARTLTKNNINPEKIDKNLKNWEGRRAFFTVPNMTKKWLSWKEYKKQKEQKQKEQKEKKEQKEQKEEQNQKECEAEEDCGELWCGCIDICRGCCGLKEWS